MKLSGYHQIPLHRCYADYLFIFSHLSTHHFILHFEMQVLGLSIPPFCFTSWLSAKFWQKCARCRLQSRKKNEGLAAFCFVPSSCQSHPCNGVSSSRDRLRFPVFYTLRTLHKISAPASKQPSLETSALQGDLLGTPEVPLPARWCSFLRSLTPAPWGPSS